MKKLIVFLTAFACIQAFGQTDNHASTAAKRKLPSVEVKTPEGKSVNTSTFNNDGKPIVICFWATWCKPCIEELNAINENYEDWKKESGFKVIAISLDDSRTMSRVGPFINGKNWEYEVYVDPNGDFKRAMNVNNPPHSFLLDSDKNIVWQHVSYVAGDEKKMYEEVLKYKK